VGRRVGRTNADSADAGSARIPDPPEATGSLAARAPSSTQRRLGPRWTTARLGPRGRYATVSFFGYVAFAVVAFAGSVIAARLLGPSGKGEYTAWSTATTIGSLLLAGSLPVGLARAYLDSRRSLLLPAVLRHGAVALGIVGVCTVPALVAGVDAIPLITCILIAIPAGVIMTDALWLMQAAKRAGALNAIRIVNAGIYTGGIGLVAYVGASNQLDLAFGFWAAGSVGAALLSAALIFRNHGIGRGGRLRTFARRGRGAYGGLVIDKLLLRLDQLVVVALAGPFSLGVYSVAVNWSEISQYVGHSIGHAVFESQSTLGDSDVSRIRRRSWVLLSAVSLAVAVSGFFLIGPIFGDAFEEAKWVMLILVPGVIARGLGYTSGQILFARGQGRRVSRTLALALGAGLVTWPVCTHLFGIEGTAAASSGVYVLQMFLIHRELSVGGAQG
jgi:O-antigen/teichoic acid export membrane protein